MKTVFTASEAARICKVSLQTIIRYFDNGELKGFRVPGSRPRRIPRDQLYAFMKDNGISTDALDGGIISETETLFSCSTAEPAEKHASSDKPVFTTGEAAKICKVSQQSIIRCFDSGALNGFRVPGARYRRIPRDQLYAFMKDNGIPTDALETREREEVEGSEKEKADCAILFGDMNEELKRYFQKHPESLYEISPRRFEELIASIMEDFGFDVELTAATRDGGRDIIAYIRSAVCKYLTFVECKKYAPENKVGVSVVRQVSGVHYLKRATKSLIVTTSYFTKDAEEEAREIEHQLELKDYNNVKEWLSRYSE